MLKLEKIKSRFFNEIYTAEKDNKKVIVILDNNCVRFHKYVAQFENWKEIGKSTYNNKNKEMCKRNALKYLEA